MAPKCRHFLGGVPTGISWENALPRGGWKRDGGSSYFHSYSQSVASNRKGGSSYSHQEVLNGKRGSTYSPGGLEKLKLGNNYETQRRAWLGENNYGLSAKRVLLICSRQTSSQFGGNTAPAQKYSTEAPENVVHTSTNLRLEGAETCFLSSGTMDLDQH